MDVKYLKNQSKVQLTNRWTLAICTIFVSNILTGVLTSNKKLLENNLGYISISFSLLYIILNGVIIAGKCRFLLNMTLDKDSAKFKDLFSQFNIFLKTFALNLLITLITTLGLIFLIIPGIIIAYMYSQSFYILVENPEMDVTDCMTASRKLMLGHKLELFYLHLTFIGWFLVGILTFGITYLWINPYFDLTCANYYLSLSSNQSISN
ncbi:MAG: DUF975 family protein [Clostridium sp.]|nr:DUF975 family protein [Clostridium sp.]